jgi:hypothetical protein
MAIAWLSKYNIVVHGSNLTLNFRFPTVDRRDPLCRLLLPESCAHPLSERSAFSRVVFLEKLKSGIIIHKWP